MILIEVPVNSSHSNTYPPNFIPSQVRHRSDQSTPWPSNHCSKRHINDRRCHNLVSQISGFKFAHLLQRSTSHRSVYLNVCHCKLVLCLVLPLYPTMALLVPVVPVCLLSGMQSLRDVYTAILEITIQHSGSYHHLLLYRDARLYLFRRVQ